MKSKFILAALSVLIVIVLAGLTWTNYQFALVSPGGTDFLTRWVGTRALLRGETPYSDQLAVEIQTRVYGRPALPGEDEVRMAYPLYSALLFAPFALISDYNLARALWMTFLEMVILALSALCLRVVDWRPRRAILYPFMLFSIFWYHSIRTLINGNAVAVVALSLVGMAWAIKYRHDGLGGVLLALATIKPQLALLPGAWALLWTLANRRGRLAAWCAGSLAVMVLAGMLVIPTWPLQNLAEIMRYTGYNPPSTVGMALAVWWPDAGLQIGWFISLALAGVLAYEWRKSLRPTFDHFLGGLALTLVASQWIGITTDPGNFIILTLPLVLVLKSLGQQPHGGAWVNLLLVLLLVGIWALFLATVNREMRNQQSPIMFFPLPLVLLIGLGYFNLIRARVTQ